MVTLHVTITHLEVDKLSSKESQTGSGNKIVNLLKANKFTISLSRGTEKLEKFNV